MDKSSPEHNEAATRTTLDSLNALPREEAVATFRRCCGATAWCQSMTAARPFDSAEKIYAAAERAFATLTESDWLQAFDAHPKIGDLNSLRMKYHGNKEWSGNEQAGVKEDTATEQTLNRLAAGNTAYESRFGFIFIVCATGKSADEMGAILESRLPNSRDQELQIAATEQTKITTLRIEKLLA